MANNVITSPPGRQSFFDDDNLDIKFDWVKLDKPSHYQVLARPSILKENWTRTLPNSQTTVQGFFVYKKRAVVRLIIFKIRTRLNSDYPNMISLNPQPLPPKYFGILIPGQLPIFDFDLVGDMLVATLANPGKFLLSA